MTREKAAWISIVALLLLVGLLVGRRFSLLPDYGDTAALRWWLWQRRALDLAVQVGLIFAGALAIATLLPKDKGKNT